MNMNDTQKPSEELRQKIQRLLVDMHNPEVGHYGCAVTDTEIDKMEEFVLKAIQATREETIQEMIKKIDDECEMLYREDMNAKVATLYRKASDIRTPCYIAGMNMAKKIINGSLVQKKEIEGNTDSV